MTRRYQGADCPRLGHKTLAASCACGRGHADRGRHLSRSLDRIDGLSMRLLMGGYGDDAEWARFLYDGAIDHLREPVSLPDEART